ncbi:RDD family protein [Aquabacterium sp.]|uniref:RDD family protein n=1 Tax=Aquabacterium sp. TaxID=1872578 RepID=UPI0035AF1221
MALDTLYQVETPEGIALRLRPAGVVPRVLAYAIDCLIRLVVAIIALPMLGSLGGLGMALSLILYFLLEWFYPVLFELGFGGATPGKRALGLRVVLDSGVPVTPAASILRNLLRAVDFMPFLYGFALVTMLVRRDFKRLGDLAAGTLVVHARVVNQHDDIAIGPAQAPARALSLSEQAAVVAWAGRARSLTPARLDELAEIARPVTTRPCAAGTDSATERLMPVAQWLLGNRGDTP